MSNPLRETQDRLHGEHLAQQAEDYRRAQVQEERRGQNAIASRPHLASFAASAAAAGVPTVSFLLTTTGRDQVGVTSGWFLNPGRGRTHTAVTRDGHLVRAFDDVAGTIGHQDIAGQVYVSRDGNGQLQATSAAYDQPANELAQTLATWLTTRGVRVVDTQTPAGWDIATEPTRSSSSAFGIRAGFVGLFTLLYIAITLVQALMYPGELGPMVTMAIVAFVGLPVPVLLYLFIPSRRLLGKPVVRIRGPKVEAIACTTCGHRNPVPAERLCSKCRRVLPTDASHRVMARPVTARRRW